MINLKVKTAFKTLALTGVVALTTNSAHAAIITVEAIGTVQHSYDAVGTYGAAGLNTLRGAEVKATWTFDTALAPSNSLNSQQRSYFGSANSDWMSSEVSITQSNSGAQLNSSSSNSSFYNYDDLYINNGAYGQDKYAIYSQRVNTETVATDNGTEEVITGFFASSAFFVDKIDDILQSADLSTTFNWTNDAGWGDYGFGSFVSYDAASSQFSWASYELSGMRAFINDVSDLSASALVTEVPEPGTVALLGFGLVGLYMARRKQNKAA